MPFSTYTELKTSIAEYLARDDLTTFVPDFIRLAEVKFNRKVRQSGYEGSTTLTPVSGVAPLPADYAEWRAVNDVSTGLKVDYATPSAIAEEAVPAYAGRPRLFTIIGSELRFAPQPSGTVALVYYKGVIPLATTPTNWLLTSHPDLYLYASLAEAETFLKNDGRITLWKSLADGVFLDMVDADRGARWGRGSMRTSDATP